MVSDSTKNTIRIRAEAAIKLGKTERMMKDFGVTERTIKNWASGKTIPRSQKVQQSVIRRGRTEDNIVPKFRDEQTGKFKYRQGEADEFKVVNKENRRRKRLLDNINETGTESQKRQAAVEFQPMSEAEYDDIQSLFDERDRALEEGRDKDWWDDWRERLAEAGYGTA
jgi:hypothetical protein